MEKRYSKTIKIISSDMIEYIIETHEIIASSKNRTLSQFLQGMFEYSNNIDTNIVIQLPIIQYDALKSDIIEIIIKYCKKHCDDVERYSEGTMDEVYKSVLEHCEYHYNQNNKEYENELINCTYNCFPLYVTYVNILINDIKPKIIKYFSQKINRDCENENKIKCIFKHILNLHKNGYCCELDKTLHKHMNNTKLKIVHSDMKILSKYVDDMKGKKLYECLLWRLYIATQYFELQKLSEIIAQIIGDYVDTLNVEEMRKFFDEQDDINSVEKKHIIELSNEIITSH